MFPVNMMQMGSMSDSQGSGRIAQLEREIGRLEQQLSTAQNKNGKINKRKGLSLLGGAIGFGINRIRSKKTGNQVEKIQQELQQKKMELSMLRQNQQTQSMNNQMNTFALGMMLGGQQSQNINFNFNDNSFGGWC